LFEIESEAGYRLEAIVPEAYLRTVRAGQPGEVRLSAADAVYATHVQEIVPEIEAASRTFLVKLPLPANAGVRAGQFGRAVFQTGEREVIVVPRAAVTQQGQLSSVLVIADGIARTRMVRTGEERDGEVEILTGLSPGERVMASRSADLTDGARVEERP
jgi:RND family efflux transporter MFP subunit